MIYLDTSVLLAHLLAEERRPLDDLWDRDLVSSRLLQFEAWNRVHAHRLEDSHGEVLTQLLARIALLELDDLVLRRALEPFPVRVRTLDALHLASMHFLVSEGQTVELACYDQRLCAAAEAIGVPLLTAS